MNKEELRELHDLVDLTAKKMEHIHDCNERKHDKILDHIIVLNQENAEIKKHLKHMKIFAECRREHKKSDIVVITAISLISLGFMVALILVELCK